MKLSVPQIVQAWMADLSPADSRKVVKELEILKQVTRKQSVRRVLLDPFIKPQERAGLLKKAGFSKRVVQFVGWLAEHNMLKNISKVASQAHAYLERRHGAVPVNVVSAVELSKQEQSDIEKAIASQHGEVASLTFSIDKRVIGGLVLRVGSLRTDLSVRGKLESVRQAIMTT